MVETCSSADSERKDAFISKDNDERPKTKTSRATRKTRKKDVLPVVELTETEKATVCSGRKVQQKEVLPLRDALTDVGVSEIKTTGTFVRTRRTARQKTQTSGEEQKNVEEVSAKGSNLQNVTLNQNMASHAQENKNGKATRTRRRANRTNEEEQTKVDEGVSSKIVSVKKCTTEKNEDRNATEIINRPAGALETSIRTRGSLKRNKIAGKGGLERTVNNGEVSSNEMVEKPTTAKSEDENIVRGETEEPEAVRTIRGTHRRPADNATVSLNVAKHIRRTHCVSNIEKPKMFVKKMRALRTIKEKAVNIEEQRIANNGSESNVNEPEEENNYVESNEKETSRTRRGRQVRYIRSVDKSNDIISNKVAVYETETNGESKMSTTKSSRDASRFRMPQETSGESGSAVDLFSLDKTKTGKESGGASHDSIMKKSVKTYPKRNRISREVKSDENNSKDVFVSSNCQVRKEQNIVGADIGEISVVLAQVGRITRSRKAASKDGIPEIQDDSISESKLKSQRSEARLLRSQLKSSVTHSDGKQARSFRPLENEDDIHNNANGNPESAIMLSRKRRRVRNAKQTTEDVFNNGKSEPVISRRSKRVKENDVDESPAEASQKQTRLSSQDVENTISKTVVERVHYLENDSNVESGMARNVRTRNKQGRENGGVMNVKKVESRKNKLFESEDITSEPPPKRRTLRQKAVLKDSAPENIVEPGIRRSLRRKR